MDGERLGRKEGQKTVWDISYEKIMKKGRREGLWRHFTEISQSFGPGGTFTESDNSCGNGTVSSRVFTGLHGVTNHFSVS